MVSAVPVNVLLEGPTIVLEDWEAEAERWRVINRDVGGHPGFYPLTIKAAYIVGVVHTLCECVSVLLRDSNTINATYIPAYGVFASGIELLGRCLRGNSTLRGNSNDLEAGFRWLASCFFEQYRGHYENVTPNVVLLQTSRHMYSINNLIALRHFAAHGQATSQETMRGAPEFGYRFGYIDYEILSHFPPLLANGLETYWGELQTNEDLCNRLAAANILALRGWPIFTSWNMFNSGPNVKQRSITEIFKDFNWQVS